METPKLWKIIVEAPLERNQIEQAAAAVPDVARLTSAIHGVELQRIDIVEGRSFVFVTGPEESASALERSLKVHAKGKKVRYAPTTAKELRAHKPPKG
jgi:hypothetical protein